MNRSVIMMSVISLLLSFLLIGCSIQPSTSIDKPIIEEPKKEEIVEVIETEGVGFDKFDSALINYIESSSDFKTENFVVSPVSIKLALGLAVEGAKDETKTEMLNALGIENETSLRELSKEMTEISNEVEENVKEKLEIVSKYGEEDLINKSKFTITNSIWKNKDRLGFLREDYTKAMLEYYNAKAEEVASSDMKDTINSYVKENTNNLIPTIVDDSVKEANTVLVNTVYLNDSWKDGLFEESDTKTKNFTTIDKNKVKKDFMCTLDDFLFYEDKDTKLLLTTTDNDFGVLYVIGDNSNILEKMNKMEYSEVIVEVPKMDIESEFKNKYMVDFMSSLGVKKAFDPWGADFRSMFDIPSDSNIFIEDIIHKTKLTTDEKGIEAAAVTAVLMYDITSAIPIEKPKPKEFIANEPFSFYVFNMNQYYDSDYESRSFDDTKLLFYGNFVK